LFLAESSRIQSHNFSCTFHHIFFAHASMLLVLFTPQMFLRVSRDDQSWLITIVYDISKSSPYNIAQLCNAGILTQLIQLFPLLPFDYQDHSPSDHGLHRLLLQLITLLGSQHITSEEGKALLKLTRTYSETFPRSSLNQHLSQTAALNGYNNSPKLSSHSGSSTPTNSATVKINLRPWYNPLILAALSAMHVNTLPISIFDCYGPHSGITSLSIPFFISIMISRVILRLDVFSQFLQSHVRWQQIYSNRFR
jgi:hypothetical protein